MSKTGLVMVNGRIYDKKSLQFTITKQSLTSFTN